MAGIGHFYGAPNDEGVGWDSIEGGWQGACVYDTYDLLQDEVALEVDEDLLFIDIIDLIPSYEWCQRDPYALPEHQELSYDWRRFCDIVKHKMRYSFFKSKEYDSPEKEFSDILRQIAVGADSLNLIKYVKKDSIVYRCRLHELTEVISSIEKLTSPPDELANFPK